MPAPSTTPDRIAALNVPPRIKSALSEFLEELQKHGGYNLVGVILYGGLTAGNYQFDRSDINIVILLRDASIQRIKEISEVLRKGWAQARIEPMILTPEEVGKSADAFPTKFLHIKNNHIVLFGQDPFSLVEVPPQLVRLRIEQELRNTALRMRKLFVNAQDNSYQLSNLLAKISATLHVQLLALLKLAGKELPSQQNYGSIIDAAADAFDLDAEALAKLPEYKRKQFDVENVHQIYGRTLSSIVKAADIADKLE